MKYLIKYQSAAGEWMTISEYEYAATEAIEELQSLMFKFPDKTWAVFPIQAAMIAADQRIFDKATVNGSELDACPSCGKAKRLGDSCPSGCVPAYFSTK